jgi:phenylalanine-4-hydroxylase
MAATEGLRGDYSRIAPDFTVEQDWASYSERDHETWRALYRRQSGLIRRYACPDYVEGVERLDAAEGVPDFARANERLSAATGWSIVAVPGLLPDAAFFDHLAARRFPVTVWIRRPEELDYLPEPDLFHDFFGHVPMLLNPIFADYMAAYGRGGRKAVREGGLGLLARLYWYTVEFGLIETADGLRAYGAGMLSSAAELPYSIEAATPRRIRFSLERIMSTEYMIDAFQKTYFVLRDFQELFDATRPDFRPIYERLAGRPALAADALLPGDTLVAHG